MLIGLMVWPLATKPVADCYGQENILLLMFLWMVVAIHCVPILVLLLVYLFVVLKLTSLQFLYI